MQSLINETYSIVLPEFRHEFHAARPNWEKGRLESCHELMKPGLVVYDIGAEVGDFTSLYRQWVGELGSVIPVEPASHQWNFIKGTWDANGFINPPAASFCGLVGDESRGFAGGLHLGSWCQQTDEEGVPDGGFVHLKESKRDYPVATIDTLAMYVVPDVIVLDIEGSEWHALAGAMHTLTEHGPFCYVSIHDVSDDPSWPGSTLGWYGKTADDIHNLMSECGYEHEELPSYGEAERFFLYTPQ